MIKRAGDLKSRLLILVQDEVGKGQMLKLADGNDACIVTFSGRDEWKKVVHDADDALAVGWVLRAHIFCSIQVANYIRRACHELKQHLSYRPEALVYNVVSQKLHPETYLNRSFIILPFGSLSARAGLIREAFGEMIFLRPNDSRKPFAGFSFPMSDMDHEMNALRQISHIQDDELCVVDRAQELPGSEFRFWIGGGRILTLAGYSHHGICTEVCPASIYGLAARTALLLDDEYGPVVADFVLDEEGVPRLVEFNAVSTSGFYAGMDFNDLIEGLEEIREA